MLKKILVASAVLAVVAASPVEARRHARHHMSKKGMKSRAAAPVGGAAATRDAPGAGGTSGPTEGK